MFFLSDEMPFSFEELLLFGAASGGKLVEDTATGNPLTFTTDVAKALKSLTIPFLPVQSGAGDPSPTNVRNIVPWDGLTVWHGGKNLIDDSKKYSPGATMCYIGALDANAHLFLKAGTYTMTADFNGEVYGMYYKEQNDQSDTSIWKPSATSTEKTFDIPKDGTYMFFAYRGSASGGVDANNIKSVMLVAGSTATAYEPYKPITETSIPFPSPVYGGALDAVTGVLTVEWKYVPLNDPDKWRIPGANATYADSFTDRKTGNSYGFYATCFPAEYKGVGTPFMRWGGDSSGTMAIFINSSELTLEEIKQLASDGDIAICYELAEPQEIQLTPQQITALVGNNTLWSDANGDMTAVFFKKA